MADWAPTVADVGALLYARTRDAQGNEIGTFTTNTRPTDAQVLLLIAQAIDDVQEYIGPEANVPQDLWDQAAKVAANGAAMLVELSFFPEQVNSGRSPYPQLKQLYDDRLKRLQEAVVSEGGDTPDSEFQSPAGGFGGPPVPISMYYPIL